ncbi:MAG: hypothetical protein ACI83P_001907 [Janthinobacterium sp.]|jgi:hypothetical protein
MAQIGERDVGCIGALFVAAGRTERDHDPGIALTSHALDLFCSYWCKLPCAGA